MDLFLNLFEPNINNPQLSGDELIGLCPFHKDTKPSFNANIETGLWLCRSCQEKGNAYQFAQKINIDPRPYITESTPSNGHIKQQTTPQISDTQKYKKYHKFFIEHWDRLKPEMWNKAVIEQCQIGYDPKHKCYVFPIFNTEGKLLNLRWHKKHQLKGVKGSFWFPKQFMAKQTFDHVIWCEGEKDTLTLLSLGIPAITNTNGVGNVPTDIEFLKRYEKVYICFDPDPAGIKGSKKVIEQLKKNLPETTILLATVPGGIDVSDWINDSAKSEKVTGMAK